MGNNDRHLVVVSCRCEFSRPRMVFAANDAVRIGWVLASATPFILGTLLGLLFVKPRSIWACMIVHLANNVVAFLLT